MITMDANSLDTNFEHTDGINACRSFLNRRTTDPALINDIPILIDFIFAHNLFNNDHYLQVKGTAMGNNLAPAYANIYMDAMETSFSYGMTVRISLKTFSNSSMRSSKQFISHTNIPLCPLIFWMSYLPSLMMDLTNIHNLQTHINIFI